MNKDIITSQIVWDFERRGIEPDLVKDVTQGTLRLWRINNNLLPKLTLADGIMIAGKYLYTNTADVQDIADDLMAESSLTAMDIDLIKTMPVSGKAFEWLTAAEVEQKYNLPKGSVRRDIHRNKFTEGSFKKVGRDWTVATDAADMLYNKRIPG